jgi:hypothetical protein
LQGGGEVAAEGEKLADEAEQARAAGRRPAGGCVRPMGIGWLGSFGGGWCVRHERKENI